MVVCNQIRTCEIEETAASEPFLGGRTRARTWDPMIKSHLLVDVAARQYELPHRPPSRRWLFTLQLRAAVVIKPVSYNSLRKTGIFAERAGDFRRFPPQDRRTGSPETNRMREKPVFTAVATSLGQLGRMQEWLAGAKGFEPRYGELEIRRSRLFEASAKTALR
jgi:hypothetical protein